MSVHIYAGPTISASAIKTILDCAVHPPVSEGDISRLMPRKPAMIGIIDGYFLGVPAVWHKEILFALDQGVQVFGSASMGALRAAELAAFGMIGVGAIFEAFRDGDLEDDDEVAVTHGPPELGYPSLSEAMVTIRRALRDAAVAGVISDGCRAKAEVIAKDLHFPQRSVATILAACREAGLHEVELSALAEWLPKEMVDQKAQDALAMLRAMKQFHADPRRLETSAFHFERTLLWEHAQSARLEGSEL